ncbi:MAG: hypothetical protein WA821_14100, partial [Anaerolineales bacterium]
TSVAFSPKKRLKSLLQKYHLNILGTLLLSGGFDTCPPEGTPGQVWRAVPGYGGGTSPPPTQPPVIEKIPTKPIMRISVSLPGGLHFRKNTETSKDRLSRVFFLGIPQIRRNQAGFGGCPLG